MYNYTYDIETGGLLLNDKTILMSKEPRPVYAQELDSLGIDAIWNYEKQQDSPYMWAESNHYIYKGKNIFNTNGGSLYVKPSVEITFLKDKNGKLTQVQTLEAGSTLQTVNIDLMIQKNREMLDIIEQVTVKKIYNVYKRYQKKLDCFHVAFSGGKDSIVLLELVKKALPRSSFMVVFGDTKMEFPDTYALIDKVEAQCKKEGIAFYRASTSFEPEESWKLFGPPSRVLRWCCSVHKAAPQTLKIREVLGKSNFVGMDFVGVRAQESVARSKYDEENYGKKQKGQHSHNSILDWTSAEIWLYIFAHGLPINEAYKKGNSRVGCLFCPMGGGKSDSFRNLCYPEGIAKYSNLIRETIDDRNINSYITNGGWIERKNGRDLIGNKEKYSEEVKDGYLNITVNNPNTDWHEWIKTLGELSFKYEVDNTTSGYIVKIPGSMDKTAEGKLFKQVFHKAAYCVGCRVCEANCRNGCISFKEGLHIDNCQHCKQCHNIDDGCLMFHSVQLPKNGGRVMRSINTFADHAPKIDWVKNFYADGNGFLEDNTLGPMQIQMFKRFLSDSKLIKANKTTQFYELTSQLGWETESTWGLLLVQLAYGNPQIKWYIDNMPISEYFPRAYLEDKIMAEGVSAKDAASITKSFKRLVEIPLGTVLNFGEVTMKGRQIEALCRCKSNLSDSRVLLYSLYRYAEACEGYYQFTLHTLMDATIESAGISPVKLFGFSEDEMEAMLRGLAAKYHDYIDVTFTHDLDKITLRDYHTSTDVLKLF
ncbi:phosphoadenosine phosphosulfate reductase domain-containing protein [Caproicibacter sp. BJN0012]|uniref:phosphoadenosine phosphosulfate reductase domain-containing protein n=1 Tax=Caproicibacter sp. BJN0012 TaxID=3110227 RepID=UPI002E112E97|nr:phosphoadenosine phosphosulfate reductase family protein [Caproicibacter sp. BJN0012]